MTAVGCSGSPTHPDQTPAIFAIAPSSGPVSGGTPVQISGNNFAAGATVTFGDAAATDIVVNSATSITAKTPARSSTGAVDVTVAVAGKAGTLGGAFTYKEDPVAPVINGIIARGSKPNEPAGFADIAEDITVTASVTDPDTPGDQLQFQWTTDVGTVTGSGTTVTWRAPADAQTPQQVTLSLTVTDGVSSATSTTIISLHNSIKEVGDLSREFLLDFSNSNNSSAFVVRNFSKSPRCEAERDSEFNDTEKNREIYRIEASSIGQATVSVRFATVPCAWRPDHPIGGDACAVIPAAWTSLCLKTNPECVAGSHPHVEGTDYVTAVFEQTQWRLCGSQFQSRDGIARPNFIR